MTSHPIKNGRGAHPQPEESYALEAEAAALALRQARRAVLIERAERRRRKRIGPLTLPPLLGAVILPFPLPAASSGLGSRRSLPARCQWLYGEGPFRDADKCGAPVAAGSAYCAHHCARAALVLSDGAAEQGGRD